MLNFLYNVIISDVTKLCYKNCLEHFTENSAILDVGIGNGVMLKNNHQLIKSKNLQITGLDINHNYIKHCERLVQDYSLEDHIDVHHESVMDFEPQPGQRFDFILFSMSFMLLSDQPGILGQVKRWLRPDGEIVFFQTMFQNRSKVIEYIKPRLKFVTSIDFGDVTYDSDFYSLLTQQELEIKKDELLKQKWFNGQYRLIATQMSNGHY